jgi:hypothetical protein
MTLALLGLPVKNRGTETAHRHLGSSERWFFRMWSPRVIGHFYVPNNPEIPQTLYSP